MSIFFCGRLHDDTDGLGIARDGIVFKNSLPRTIPISNSLRKRSYKSQPAASRVTCGLICPTSLIALFPIHHDTMSGRAQARPIATT